MAAITPPPSAIARCRPPFLTLAMASAPAFISFRCLATAPFAGSVAARRSSRWCRPRVAVDRVDFAETEEISGSGEKVEAQASPFELYVCNLPRNFGESELFELVKPFGNALTVEICRNSETGVSKGCGFVSMSSAAEAKAVMTVLDGSDLEGREIRMKYSADMVPQRKMMIAPNTSPQKYEGNVDNLHTIFVGNLSWSVTSNDLLNHFSQFGSIVDIKLLHDRKRGGYRVYAFIKFSTADEVATALLLSGTEFFGRQMVLREARRK